MAAGSVFVKLTLPEHSKPFVRKKKKLKSLAEFLYSFFPVLRGQSANSRLKAGSKAGSMRFASDHVTRKRLTGANYRGLLTRKVLPSRGLTLESSASLPRFDRYITL